MVKYLQVSQKTPFFNTEDSLFQYSADMIVMCMALLICAVYLNGVTALLQAAVCIVSAVLCEYVFSKAILKKNTLGDLSAVSSALLIALMLPSCAPLWVGATASCVSYLVAKLPFGSARYAPFVPEAVAICFCYICFPQQMSLYPASSSGFELCFSTSENFVSGQSLLDLLKDGSSVKLNALGIFSLLSGSYPSALGTSSMLAFIGVCAYMLIKRPSRLISSFGYILASAVFAFCFPRITSGRLPSVALELSAGSLVFVALLILNDPVSSPKKPLASFIYGITAGFICMLLRHYAKVYDPSCFSVLIINALWPIFENTFSKKELSKNKKSKSKVSKNKQTKKISNVEKTEVKI